MNNKQNGNRFEQELAKELSDAGFWVHVLQQNKAGQPADLIAVKGDYHTLIDCKVMSRREGFPLRRVEENQQYAMKRFSDRTGYACWFAMKLPDGEIHMLSSVFVFSMIENDYSAIGDDFIRNNTLKLGEWLEKSAEWVNRPDENDDI